MWLEVFGIKNKGAAMFKEIADRYNKNLVYLDTRIDPTTRMGSRMTVGGMKA